MNRNRGFITSLAVLVTLYASAPRAGAGGEPDAARQQEAIEKTFLGFSLGEEIRYQLEREDEGRRGMRTIWSIRLQEVDGETGLGVFALTYEVGGFGGSPGSPQGQPRGLMGRTTATAWINPYGFPTRVRFTTQRNTPMGGIEYTVEYRYENKRFLKELEGSDKDQQAKLDDYRVIDLDTPSGMYLFMPIDAECVGAARQARGNRGGGRSGGGGGGGTPPGGGGGGGGGTGGRGGGGTGGGGGGGGRGGGGMGGGGGGSGMGGAGSRGGGRANMDPPCQGREPAFANPGLLNLTMPALWETGTGALELLALAPTGVLTTALMGGGNRGGGGSGISIAGFNILGGGGPDVFGDAKDAFQMFALAADSELMQIDVGGRPVDVWRLRASAPLESAYVDGDGSIVRLDLPADPETGERYWIRRLRPSEY